MTRIAICGVRGRMGRALLRLAREHEDIRIIGGIARTAAAVDEVTRVVTLAEAPALLRDTDVVIDFSAPAATEALITDAADVLRGRALVVGTTGLGAGAQQRLDALAATSAVLTAANFSMGIQLLLALTERAAASLAASSFDIEVVEAHHRRKTDAPSGTALALGAAAARGRHVTLDAVRRDGRTGETGARPAGEIGFHAVRGGGIAGEHRVIFAGEREVIELRHEALDRAVFAAGALEAARWIAGRTPGRYTMQHVLGI